MSSEWFLIQCKPNSHRIAERNLKRQGFETFLPLAEVTRRKSTKFVNELRPLFPGYMFVTFDPSDAPWRKINSTQGVSRLVSFDGRPKPVPSALTSELQARCDEAGKLLPVTDLEVGAEIKISSGPFSEFVGTVEAIDPDKRVWVLLELMGQKSKVKLESSQVSEV